MIPVSFWKLERRTRTALWALALATGLGLPGLAATLAGPAENAPIATMDAVGNSASANAQALAMADALSTLLDSGVEGTLAGSMRIASLAARLQADSLDVPGTPGIAPAVHASPSLALQALLAAQGVTPTIAQALQMVQLDLLPAPAAQALTRFVDAFAAHWLTTQAAYAGADVQALEAIRAHPADPAFEFATLGIDYPALFATRATFLDAAVDLRLALDATQADAPPTQVPPVFSLDFGVADNTYAEDFALVWDEGGNDLYLNNAGGSGNCLVSCFAGTRGAAALFDGEGDDRYVSNRGQGVNGGGYIGTGLLVDEAGNDVYLARDDATNGAGMGGIGLLIDQTGHDSYTAWGWGVNGAGYIGGVGTLLDRGGNDAYFGSDSGVNGGGFVGRGLLYDESGADSYQATAAGVNGGAVAGVGLLLDRNGVDTYVDRAGGSGTDMTVIPKELGGVQLDQ